MEVNRIVVATIVPRVVWVIRYGVADIVNYSRAIRHYWETAFFNTATIVLDEHMVVTIVIGLDFALVSIRNMVFTPHSWLRLAAIATSGTARIEYHNIARISVGDINVSEVVKVN
jgi:hypothetical protein